MNEKTEKIQLTAYKYSDYKGNTDGVSLQYEGFGVKFEYDDETDPPKLDYVVISSPDEHRDYFLCFKRDGTISYSDEYGRGVSDVSLEDLKLAFKVLQAQRILNSVR